MEIYWILLQFLAAGAVLLFAGEKLAHYGEILAEKTRLGATWIGLIFIAATTSFPELSTTISATLKNQPDLAAGNIFGSNMFNIFILGILDLYPKNVLLFQHFNKLRTSHVISAIIGLLITGIYLFGMVIPKEIIRMPEIFAVDLLSILVFILFFIGMKEVFLFEKQNGNNDETEKKFGSVTLPKTWTNFLIYCAVVGIIGYFISSLGKSLDNQTGWGESFIGSLFLAIATSLPELIVSIALLRKGLFDMIMGDIMGSNMFNLTIIAACDFFYRGGSIIKSISSTHQLAASMSIFLTGIAIMGIYYQRGGISKKHLRIGWHNIAIVIFYLISIRIIFQVSSTG